jgi:hypothetical protein
LKVLKKSGHKEASIEVFGKDFKRFSWPQRASNFVDILDVNR